MIAAALTESDGFALAMLGIILLSFAVLLSLIGCMFRNASRRDPEVDRLIEELEEEEKSRNRSSSRIAISKKQEWEREEDWWKS